MAYNNNALEDAYHFILKKLKSGDWKPGDKIWSEDVLVKKIGVSKIAVRGAVEKFSGMGVLKKIQGSGTYVETLNDLNITGVLFFDIGQSHVLQLLAIRKHLEPAAVEMFMKNSTLDDIEELQASYNQMVLNEDNQEKFHEADFLFHRILAKGSDNIYLLKINDLLVDALRGHQKNLYSSIGPEIGLKYHALVLEYIRKKDVAAAMHYMQSHIEETIDALKNVKAEIA